MSAVPNQPVSAVPGEGRAPVAEDPRFLAANLGVGVRLFASATVFTFMAFVFAFLYLKTINSNDNWRPHNAHPAPLIGIAILVCVLACAALVFVAGRSLAAGAGGAWTWTVGLALLLSIAVVVIQIVQYTNYGFSPEGGGYASVFVGWTAIYLLFWLGAVYWIETLLAQTLRGRPRPEESELIHPHAALVPSTAACLVYLETMAGIWIVTWVLLYLVK